MRVITNVVFSGAEGVDKPHSKLRSAKISPVDAAFRAVHAAAFSSVAVVQKLSGKAG